MDSRVNIFKAAFDHQREESLIFPCTKAVHSTVTDATFQCFEVAPSMAQILAMCFAAFGGFLDHWR